MAEARPIIPMLIEVNGILNYIEGLYGPSESSIRCGSGSIHVAAMISSDDPKPLEQLLDMDADIHLRELLSQKTALHKAVDARNINIVNTLLKRGADPNLADSFGETPLFSAVNPYETTRIGYMHPNQIPIARSLLEYHADVNIRNSQGETPLMYAACGFSLDLIKILLKAGADVHSKSECNQTCLHYLFSRPGKTNMMMELIKAGASVLDRDDDGIDPIHRIVDSDVYSVEQKVVELKELTKFSNLVKYPEKLDYGIAGELGDLIGAFYDECYAEVHTLQLITLGPTWTLRCFALHGIGQNPPSIIDTAFEKLMEQNFSIYNDYLASHFDKDYLIEKLMEEEIVIYSRTNLVDAKLHACLIPDFCESLTKLDIYNLLNVICKYKLVSVLN